MVTKRLTSFDGVEIAYDEWGESSGEPPVVLLHGFAVTADLNWVVPGIVEVLVASGRHVVAHDARGHGRSDKPHDPAAYGTPAMARDLGAVLDVIGAAEVDLVGYSLGAIVSLVAATQEARVRRLIVGGVGAAAAEIGGVDTRVTPCEVVAAAFETDDAASIADPTAAQMRSLADSLLADRIALAAQARALRGVPIALDRIAVPTLVLAGDADPLSTRPEVLARAIPRAQIEIVSGDHVGAVLEPRFGAAIVEFLADTGDALGPD